MMRKGFLACAAAMALGAALTLYGESAAEGALLPDPAGAVRDEPGDGGGYSLVLAGGCFWGMQEVFDHVRGVKETVVGYANGDPADAHYDRVSTGRTGHAEAIRVTYDPDRVSLGQLLKVYFAVAHDPTLKDAQGPDRGPQYRSEIFTANPAQEQAAKAYIAELDRSKLFPAPIATKVETLAGFYPAEDYHQHYAEKNPDSPYIVINDLPKVIALEKTYPELYRDDKGSGHD